MNKTVRITRIKIPTIIKADKVPVLPSSKVTLKLWVSLQQFQKKLSMKYHFQHLLKLFVHPTTLKCIRYK